MKSEIPKGAAYRGPAVHSSEELERMQRLPGAGRDMSDEEITTAALSDPDTLSPDDDAPLAGKVGREALADIFPPDTVEALLAPRK